MKKLFTGELKLAYLTVFEILIAVFLISIPIGFVKSEGIQIVLCVMVSFLAMPFVLKLLNYNMDRFYKE